MSKEPIVHIGKEAVEQMQELIKTAFKPENMPSMRTQTLQVLRYLCDQIEAAPDSQDFGLLTVDFRTSDFDLESTLELDKPLTRYVGIYAVDNPFMPEED